MATRDGRVQIWYADGNGNVAGYTESVGDIAGTIIDAYNEHFGTDIAIWTPETKTLRVGDSVPNWNAYEKIEMQQVSYYKFDISNGMEQAFVAMEVVNGNVNVYCANIDDSDNLMGYNNSGQWISSSIRKTFLDEIAAIAQHQFDNYKGIERIVKAQGNIPDWNDYSLLS